MRTETNYICEICNRKHDTPEEALACEARGTFDMQFMPPGLMHAWHHNGYVGIFANPRAELQDVPRGHWLQSPCFWACRSPKFAGDTLDENLCGGGLSYLTNDSALRNMSVHCAITGEETRNAEFKRMVEYLRSQGIVPTFYEKETGELVTVLNPNAVRIGTPSTKILFF